MQLNPSKKYTAILHTEKGDIQVELFAAQAPTTVNNFVFLAREGFYDGTTFHRVIGGFMAQGGDPTGTGRGGPGYKFSDEQVKGDYTAGAIAMANSGKDTNGSQFFICTTDDTSLPKSYNLFGHVVKGLDIAKLIQGPGDDPATKNIQPDLIDHLIVVAAP